MTFRLHMVARLSERISEHYYRKQVNLLLPECRVIGITASHGTVSFKRVAAEAHLEKSYASRVVSGLVERGIIAKRANPDDKRSVLLELTDYGRTVHEQTYSLALQLNDHLQAPFSVGQAEDFIAFLGALEQQLRHADALIEQGDWPAGGGAPTPSSADSLPPPDGTAAPLDRAFARQLHDLLGRYLAGKE
jgi:DNA-binding MarR family transcriptional regulator